MPREACRRWRQGGPSVQGRSCCAGQCQDRGWVVLAEGTATAPGKQVMQHWHRMPGTATGSSIWEGLAPQLWQPPPCLSQQPLLPLLPHLQWQPAAPTSLPPWVKCWWHLWPWPQASLPHSPGVSLTHSPPWLLPLPRPPSLCPGLPCWRASPPPTPIQVPCSYPLSNLGF